MVDTRYQINVAEYNNRLQEAAEALGAMRYRLKQFIQHQQKSLEGLQGEELQKKNFYNEKKVKAREREIDAVYELLHEGTNVLSEMADLRFSECSAAYKRGFDAGQKQARNGTHLVSKRWDANELRAAHELRTIQKHKNLY